MAEFQQQMDDARSLERRDQLDDALQLYLALVDAAPASFAPELWTRIAGLQIRLGSTTAAAESYRRGAELLAARGLANAAILLLRRSLLLHPDDSPALRALGRLAAAQGYGADAREAFRACSAARTGSDPPHDAPDPLRELVGPVGASDEAGADGRLPGLQPTTISGAAEPTDPDGVAPLEGLQPTRAEPQLGADPDPEPLLESAGSEPDVGPLPMLEVPDGTASRAATVDTAVAARERLRRDPDDLEAWAELLRYLEERGSPEELGDALAAAHPRFAAADRPLQALDLLERLCRLRPCSLAMLRRAVEYAHHSGVRERVVHAWLMLARSFGSTDDARAGPVYERLLELDPSNAEARHALGRPGGVDGEGDGFVDLGAMLMDEAGGEPTTRVRVEGREPRAEGGLDGILALFRDRVAERIDPQDASTHYDLGLAFKGMGLLDDAIAQLQMALRGGAPRLATLEVLGACFVARGEPAVAARVLRHAAGLPGADDTERVGIHYWLARAEQALGRRGEARSLYERVVAMDISFRDAARRLESLRRADDAPGAF